MIIKPNYIIGHRDRGSVLTEIIRQRQGQGQLES